MNTKKKLSELHRVDVDAFKKQEKFPIYLVLDNIRSAYNVGSMFRTADAFNLTAIYLLGYTPVPPNSLINKSAIGAQDSMQWKAFETNEELLEQLKRDKVDLIAIEQTHEAMDLQNFPWKKDQAYALIVGNEMHGVQQALIDASHACIEIPQFGTKHSLNVANAASVVLWDCVRGSFI